MLKKIIRKSWSEKASVAGGLGSGNVGDFPNLQCSSVDDILSRIPQDANKHILTPQLENVWAGNHTFMSFYTNYISLFFRLAIPHGNKILFPTHFGQ